ncbi:MAG: CBS domain-containing protein, partial [Acetatifactor sp.]|nr:CBS domain-containing protein [Acetatifactor sp.]
PLEEILRVADDLDFVLIMCTIPGISGQKFNSGNIERIRELRRLMPNIKIHVDGGIDVRRMEIIKHYNLELIVVGSFLANVEEGGELTERICQLRYSENDITVEEVMIPLHCLTTIDEKDSFETVLDALETDKLSIVTVVQDGCLLGIISDGDVRRIVKKHHGDCFNLKAGDIMNSSPQILSYDTKVNLVLYHKMFLERGVLAIPCVKDDKLIGILDCTSL